MAGGKSNSVALVLARALPNHMPRQHSVDSKIETVDSSSHDFQGAISICLREFVTVEGGVTWTPLYNYIMPLSRRRSTIGRGVGARQSPSHR
jgi:hypothetical protein